MPVEPYQLPPITIINGVITNHIASHDRGLAYGDGVFETIRCNCFQPVLWQEHIARLQQGLTRLAISFDVSVLAEQQAQLFAALKQQQIDGTGVLKIVVTRGEGGRGYLPSDSQPTVMLSWHSLPDIEPLYAEQGVALTVCKMRLGENSSLAGIKHLNRLEQVLAAQEVEHSSFTDGVLLNGRDEIIETTAKNVFFVEGSSLLTPVLNTAGVEGTMRNYIINTVAPALGLSVEEKVIPLSYVEQAAEAFVCNSVVGVWPIRQILEKPLHVGETTQLIQQQVVGLFNV